jgi:fatty-acyl-CoA synthase
VATTAERYAAHDAAAFDLLPGLQDAVDRKSSRSITVTGPDARTLSYAELWERSGWCAAALRRRGVSVADRVAVGMATSVEILATLLALIRIGATIVPVHVRRRLRRDGYDAERFVVALRAGGARWCVVHDAVAEDARELAGGAGIPATVLGAESLIGPGGDAADAADGAGGDPPASLGRETLLLIQFSSGSTADPKGICVTRGNVAANLAGIATRVHLSRDDTVVSWLPLFHDMGLVGAVLTAMWAGASLVLVPPTQFLRDPLAWLEASSRTGGTVTVAPQFAYDLCVARARSAPDRVRALDLSAVRLALNGSEAVHWSGCRAFESCFTAAGWRANVLQPVYGLAENCVAVTMREPLTEVVARTFDRGTLAVGSSARSTAGGADTGVTLVGTGRAVDGTVVAVRRADGRSAAAGEVGHVAVGGASASAHVVDGLGQARPAGRDGWVDTGDVGVVHADELFIVGRTKEIFKCGGRTFVPADIEHGLVAAGLAPAGGVAAFSIFDPAGGTEGLVVVIESVPPDGAVGAAGDAVRLFVLGKYEIPLRDLVFARRGTIPRTSSGKTQRVRLREGYVYGALQPLSRG